MTLHDGPLTAAVGPTLERFSLAPLAQPAHTSLHR